MLHQAGPSGKLTSRKTANRKKALLRTILSLLTPAETWKLRARYAEGKETIAELSQISKCPPVLLYSILTPLYVRTVLKTRLIRVEKQVALLEQKGWSVRKIARELKLPEKTVRENSTERFIASVYADRPWYNDRAPKPSDPDELIYDEATLPPTARLGWTDGKLTDIPPDLKGRCPTCGCLVFLPCLACRVRRDMRLRTIPKAEECNSGDDEGDVEPDLLFG